MGSLKICILGFILLIMTGFISRAQKINFQYGSISPLEVNLTSCSYDTDADAVVFFDIGKSWFELNEEIFDLMYERTCRIKILKESGIKYANIKIPLYDQGIFLERIHKLEGISWNEKDGQLISTDLKNSNHSIIRENEEWTTLSFVMPDVKVGTILEFHYITRSNNLMNLNSWRFQSEIPTDYSFFEANMIPFYEFLFLLQGNIKDIKRNEFLSPNIDRQFRDVRFQDKVFQFSMRNVPGFKDLDFISLKEDYISKVDFQISKYTLLYGGSVEVLKTWPKLIKEFLNDESFGRYMRRSEALADNIVNLDSITGLDEVAKLNSVIETIEKNYHYNGVRSHSATGTVQELLKKKSGSSGDLNLMGIGILKASGLDAFPVIMSTRDNGKIKYDFPKKEFFNYVVIGVKINGKYILADATDPLLTSYLLPVGCLNNKGLVVKDGEETWLDLSQKEVSRVQTMLKTEISTNGLVSKSEVIINSTSYEALKYKKQFGESAEDIRKELISMNYEVDENNAKSLSYSSYSSPYSLIFSASLKNGYSGNNIFIAPFLNQVLTVNPIRPLVRTIPVDFMYPVHYSYESTIVLPENYKVTYIPEAVNTDNENVNITYYCNQEGNIISAKASYTFKKGIYPETMYPGLRLYYETIIKKLNDKIVITKQ